MADIWIFGLFVLVLYCTGILIWDVLVWDFRIIMSECYSVSYEFVVSTTWIGPSIPSGTECPSVRVSSSILVCSSPRARERERETQKGKGHTRVY